MFELTALPVLDPHRQRCFARVGFANADGITTLKVSIDSVRSGRIWKLIVWMKVRATATRYAKVVVRTAANYISHLRYSPVICSRGLG